MYKPPSRPVLPELVCLSPDDEGKEKAPLYLLNWKPKERQMKTDFDRWKRGCTGDKKAEYEATELFPAEYVPWLYGLRFAVPGNYHREIAYQAKHGQEEWSRNFPDNFTCGMDTMIREACLGSAIAHFKTVFLLLADCLQDPATGKRNELYWFAKVAMLIYFWDGQTGRGLLLNDDFSGGYGRLPDIYLDSKTRKRDPATVKPVGDFMSLVKERRDKDRGIAEG